MAVRKSKKVKIRTLKETISDAPIIPKPTITLRGEEVKYFTESKLKDKVKLEIEGTIIELRIDRYDKNRKRITIEMNSIKKL